MKWSTRQQVPLETLSSELDNHLSTLKNKAGHSNIVVEPSVCKETLIACHAVVKS